MNLTPLFQKESSVSLCLCGNVVRAVSTRDIASFTMSALPQQSARLILPPDMATETPRRREIVFKDTSVDTAVCGIKRFNRFVSSPEKLALCPCVSVATS